MTLNKYQTSAFKTAIYPDKGRGSKAAITYTALGLGEAGEVQNKVIGGLLWYIAALSLELGYTLEQIAEMNLESLAGRMDRGTIKGDGDDR